MLPVGGAAVVLWLHVIAASIWIGGQVTVAVLIPLLRGGPGLAAAAGRRFQVVAWPAFALLVATGVLNMRHRGIGWGDLGSTETGRTLGVKLVLVLVSGAAAALHAFVQAPSSARRPSAAMSAALGALSVTAAVGAALFGVVIAGG